MNNESIKICKKCKQEINSLARICHYCRSNQYVFDDFKSYLALVVIALFSVICIIAIPTNLFSRSSNLINIEDYTIVTTKFITMGFSTNMDKAHERAYSDIYTVSEISNISKIDLSNVVVQFIFTNAADETIDIINGTTGDIPANGNKLVKIHGRAIKENAEYKNVKIKILEITALDK